MKICKCGCGQPVVPKTIGYDANYIHGHYRKGKHHSLKSKKIISEKRKGQTAWNKGKSGYGKYGTSRNRYLLKLYGITEIEYNELFLKQNGKCAICKDEQHGRFKLSVDHNHKTGKVRGLLCGQCNYAIGLLNDNKDNCLNAYEYLKEYDKK